MIVAMLLYHAAVAVTFAAPHFRYILPQVPFIIMLAAMGIASFNLLRRQSKSSALILKESGLMQPCKPGTDYD
jgi:hypothetical protein